VPTTRAIVVGSRSKEAPRTHPANNSVVPGAAYVRARLPLALPVTLK
jgi:hypothetical protein